MSELAERLGSSTNPFLVSRFWGGPSPSFDRTPPVARRRVQMELVEAKAAPNGALELDLALPNDGSASTSRSWMGPFPKTRTAVLAWGQEPQLAGLLEALEQYACLSFDWDGYGGVPASPGAVASAKAFIRRLPDNTLLPEPMLAGSGEISLYWENGAAYIEASFPGDDTYHFFSENCVGGPSGDDLSASAVELDAGLQGALAEKFSR